MGGVGYFGFCFALKMLKGKVEEAAAATLDKAQNIYVTVKNVGSLKEMAKWKNETNVGFGSCWGED